MTCAEFKDLAAAYALGVLDEGERAACEAHLRETTHEGCPEALAEAQRTVDAIPLALPPLEPRPELWAAIAKDIAPAAVTPLPRRKAWPVVVPTVLFVVAAAAAIYLFLDRSALVDRVAEGQRHFDTALASAADLRRACETQLGTLKSELQARQDAVAMLNAPGAKLVRLAGDAKAGFTTQSVVVILDPQQGKAAIVGQGLAAQPGKDYELWVIKGDAAKAAGLLRGDASGGVAFIVDPAVMAAGVDAFAVSVEATGGGDAPKGPIILVGKT